MKRRAVIFFYISKRLRFETKHFTDYLHQIIRSVTKFIQNIHSRNANNSVYLLVINNSKIYGLQYYRRNCVNKRVNTILASRQITQN